MVRGADPTRIAHRYFYVGTPLAPAVNVPAPYAGFGRRGIDVVRDRGANGRHDRLVEDVVIDRRSVPVPLLIGINAQLCGVKRVIEDQVVVAGENLNFKP